MAFCEKCGAELSDGAEFCSKCGNKVNSAIVNNNQSAPSYSESVPERVKTAQELSKMYEYFGKKQNLYDEYDYLTNEINRTRRMKGGVIACLVLGILFIFFSILIFLLVSIGRSKQGLAWSDVDGLVWVLIIFNVVLGILFLGIFILCEVTRKSKYNKSCDRYVEVANELTEYYNNYGYCMVGGEYTNPKILYQIADVVRQGRADTSKEAINVMLDTVHKNKMEMFARQTAANTAAAARGAKASAVFCAANFFFK